MKVKPPNILKSLNFAGIFVLFLIILQSCTTSINTIKKNTKKYDGKKVKISGKVISSLQLIDIDCFTLKDKTGNICVVTDNFLPMKEEKLVVKGIVKGRYPYLGRTILVVKENKMKSRNKKSQKRTKNKL